jgi:hypothetical protein
MRNQKIDNRRLEAPFPQEVDALSTECELEQVDVAKKHE